MINLNDLEIEDFICNEVSSFALSIIDIETNEVIYTNNAMKEFMMNAEADKCWASIYGQTEMCSWCTIKDTSNLKGSFEFEYFNEKTNKWYQVQNKKAYLNNKKEIFVSIATDISVQKEAQGQFITTQVKLIQQTEALKKAQKELQLLASIDSMTKLYNRRYFSKISESILGLARRDKTQISIAMIDVDYFKKVNDLYGHKVGDDVLIILASLLKEQSRKSDIVCRWGGEEFIILLPNTSLEGALTITEKIRKAVQAHTISIETNRELNFTISIGVSSVMSHDINIEPAIHRADIALYEAKHSGRNIVKSCTE